MRFSAAAAEKRTLTIGMTQFPSTFHPIIDSMLAKSYVMGAVLRPLTVYDHDWQLACMLCEEAFGQQMSLENTIQHLSSHIPNQQNAQRFRAAMHSRLSARPA